jgi:2-dehydro-3-deoxygluconokinase
MILCFGETLLRLIPQLNGQWIEQAMLKTYIGGAELNTAFALAKWKQNVAYATALPDHYLADEIVQYLAQHNIDVSRVQRREGRIGTYFLPQGSDVKTSGVIYDRMHSSFAQLTLEELNFEEILDGVHWLHISAICPALHRGAAEISLELLRQAKQRGITTSIDFNYRHKLWQWGALPTEIMPALTTYCDVLMGNLWAVQSLLGIETQLENNAETDPAKLLEAAGKSMTALHKLYPNVQTIAYTFRFEETYFGVLQHNQERATSEIYPIRQIVDKVGSGDTFMAALILGIKNGWDAKDIIAFCARAAVQKLGETGDHTQAELQEIMQNPF